MKHLNRDKMRVAFAVAAIKAKDTKATVCMVRTVMQDRVYNKQSKGKESTSGPVAQ